MDVDDTITAVEEETTTELGRLGSDKALLAATDAKLAPDSVWTAAATREAGVADAIESWTVDDDSSETVQAAFSTAATAATDRLARIDAAPEPPDALSAHLETVDGSAARVGAGLVAVPLVLDRLYLQVVSFFINEADESSADVARELRSGASDLSPAREALGALDEDACEMAREAAVEAVDVAYGEYAAALEEMGLDPKPIC